MPPKPQYSEGEKVLCLHGPLLYEAKCLKCEVIDKLAHYFVHYSGWNKNWDEWVPESRILKYNDANVRKQKELENTYVKTKKSKKSAKKEKPKETETTISPNHGKPAKAKRTKNQNDSKGILSEKDSLITPEKHSENQPCVENQNEPKPRIKIGNESKTYTEYQDDSKIGRENQNEFIKNKKPRLESTFEEEPKPKFDYKLPIPQKIKDWLLDDWDLINRQRKLVGLPVRITVDHIISNYIKDRVADKNLPQLKERAIISNANYLRDAFNAMLGKLLLYKFERPQYADILYEYRGLNMSEIYGPSHFLRMFTKLSEFLKETNLNEQEMEGTIEHLTDFIEYLSTTNSFNIRNYVVAPPEYYRRAL